MRHIFSIFLCIAALLSSNLHAEDTKNGSKPKRLPKSGLLAVASVSGAGSRVVSELFGDQDMFEKELPPISGSVSRHGEANWRFSVSNNSEDRYVVNVDLIQKNENGAQVKFSSYSYTLNPGHSNGGEVQAAFNALSAELNLRSYRNMGSKAPSATENKK